LLTAVFVGWFVAKESLKSDLALQGGAFTLWYNLIRFVTPIAVAIVFFYNLMS
jgi:NSS family neurotransmitter:Na+ symporter